MSARGDCAFCGTKDTEIVGSRLKATGSASAYMATRPAPACEWCFHTNRSIPLSWDADEPTKIYKPGELDALKKEG